MLEVEAIEEKTKEKVNDGSAVCKETNECTTGVILLK
jgi:hypothetical protein